VAIRLWGFSAAFSPNYCTFKPLAGYQRELPELATDLLPFFHHKIGFPGWPEPILDSVTGLGRQLRRRGLAPAPFFISRKPSWTPYPH